MNQKVVKFGGKENEQDYLAQPVDEGIKVATSSLVYLQELRLNESSQVGDRWLIQDSQGKQMCEVEAEAVKINTFASITNDFAVKEGDQSFNNWHDIHWTYYSTLLSKYGKKLTDTTQLECVYFKKLG